MSKIDDYFLQSYTPPGLTTSKHVVNDIGMTSQYLKSRQNIFQSDDNFCKFH